MAKEIKDILRRRFILKSAAFLAGGMTGFNPLLKALACNTVSRPQISIIIDDIGFSRSRAESFLKLDLPLTYSVMPRLRNSLRIAEMIYNQGHEIMLHQPMEPYNEKIDPGPCALYVDDNPDTIRSILQSNLADYPFAVGVNNHMGSRFTSHETSVAQALQIIKANRRFFLDSITTRRSKGYETALKFHMAAGRRDIFLDYNPEERNILLQLQKLLNCARICGQAIGIGHPYPQTVQALQYFINHEDLSGYSFTYISKIIYQKTSIQNHVQPI